MGKGSLWERKLLMTLPTTGTNVLCLQAGCMARNCRAITEWISLSSVLLQFLTAPNSSLNSLLFQDGTSFHFIRWVSIPSTLHLGHAGHVLEQSRPQPLQIAFKREEYQTFDQAAAQAHAVEELITAEKESESVTLKPFPRKICREKDNRLHWEACRRKMSLFDVKQQHQDLLLHFFQPYGYKQARMIMSAGCKLTAIQNTKALQTCWTALASFPLRDELRLANYEGSESTIKCFVFVFIVPKGWGH